METILMFMGAKGFSRQTFDVKLDGEEGPEYWTWSDVRKYDDDLRHQIECFPLQTVEVSGELSEIVDLFVRINSTGKRLTSGERRHARFYESRFLSAAEKLVHRHEAYLLQQRILSRGQLDRMKGTELFSELLMSINQGGLINKKTALDRAIGNESINGNSLNRIVMEFTKTINAQKKMFPDIRNTRFRNTAEYYTLFMVIWEMLHSRMVVTHHGTNRMAFELLQKLSTGVDELRNSYREAKASKPAPPYSDYLLTVQGDTDSSATRERRAKIVRDLLFPLYDRKDANRAFSTDQRRILWNSDLPRKCVMCACSLTWDDFTIDHVKAYVRGGQTNLKNAQLMCKPCNSKKGGK